MKETIKDLLVNTHSENNELEGLMIDGALDYEKWNKQDLKILFYYKETYGYENAGVSSISDLYDGWITTVKTYKKAALFANLLMKFSENREFPEYKLKELKAIYNDNKTLKDTISKTAFVNVNKLSNDNSKSNNRKIRQRSQQYPEMLKKQLKILNPDIIICGGRVTADSLYHDLGYLSKNKYSFGVPEKIDGKIIVPINHLSAPAFWYAKIYDACGKIIQLM